MKSAILIDVHTGLGSPGDSVLSVPDEVMDTATHIFSSAGSKVTGWATSGTSMEGYDDSEGDLVGGLARELFKEAKQVCISVSFF